MRIIAAALRPYANKFQHVARLPVRLCAAAAVMFEKFRESDFMKKVMYGIRPACLGLIIAVVCSLTATNYTNAAGSISYGAALIGVAATVLLLKFKVSIPKVILLSAVLGLFLTR